MQLPSTMGTRLFSITTTVALLSFALLAQSALACEVDDEALDVRDPQFAEKLAARYQAGITRPVVRPAPPVNPR